MKLQWQVSGTMFRPIMSADLKWSAYASFSIFHFADKSEH